MANQLTTRFKYDDADNAKILGTKTLLVETNDLLNSLGKNADFGKRIGNESIKSADGIGKLNKEVDSLKAKTETFIARPTISRYYENEAAEVKKSINSINRSIESLNQPRNNPGKLSLDRIASGINDDGISRVKPKINIDYGESRFNTAAQPLKPTGGRGNIGLSNFQKTNLGYQINDVLTGLASGQNPAQILAQQGGQIAQIFSKEQIAGFAASYGGLVSILGAGTIAIAATYKITGDLRAEAERRLKAEEQIAGAINKQVLSQQQALRDSQQSSLDAARSRQFSRDLQTDSIDQLRQQLATNRKLFSLNPSGGDAARLEQEKLSLEARIDQIPYDNNSLSAKAFDERNESFKRNRENERAADKLAAEKRKQEAEKRKQELEKIQDKLKDLGKNFTDVFDNLRTKQGANNPFVAVFSEADKSVNALRENLKGLSPELQTAALQIQQKLDSNALFETRLSNDFAVSDLRERANDLRSFKQPKIEDANKFFKDFIEAGIKDATDKNGGSLIRYNSNIFTDKNGRQFTSGFTQTNLRDESNTVFERTGNGGFFRRDKTFADLSNREKSDFINRDNLPLQEKLSRQFDLARNRNALNDDQQAIVDRKIISLSSSFNPEQFNSQQRDLIATANEKEADRRANAEREASADRKKGLEYQKAISDNLQKIRQIAEKDGLKGLENVLRVVTENGVSAELQPAANSSDTANNYYDADFNFRSNGGFSNR